MSAIVHSKLRFEEAARLRTYDTLESRNHFMVKLLFYLFFFCCFLISPYISLVVAFVYFSFKSESVVTSIILGYSVAFPALFFAPLSTDDASRIFNLVDQMRNMGNNQIMPWLHMWASDYLNYPIYTLMMWLVSKISENDSLLSFLVAGAAYSCVFFLCWKISRWFDLSVGNKYLMTVACVAWVGFLELVSGMRFTLASLIVVLILFNVFVFVKRADSVNYASLLWLIIPVLIHPAVLMLLVPAGMALVLARMNLPFKMLALLVCVILLVFLFSGIGSSVPYVQMIRARLFAYQSTTFDYLSSPQRIFHFVAAVFFGLISFVEMSVLSKHSRESVLGLRGVYNLVSAYLPYFLIIVISVTFGMRLTVGVPLIFIICLGVVNSRKVSINVQALNAVVLLLVILSGIIFNISAIHIDYTGLRFFLF